MAATSIYVPRVVLAASCLSRVFSKINKFGLTQVPFKLLLLPWVSEHVRCFCASFNSPLAPLKSSLTGLQNHIFLGLVFML